MGKDKVTVTVGGGGDVEGGDVVVVVIFGLVKG